MKQRNGFVSNSSSSSFVVAIKNAKKKVKIEIEVDLTRFGKIISNLEELQGHWKNNYCYKDVTSDMKYQHALKAISEGKTIIVGSFGSDGETVEQLLCDKGLKDLVNDENIEIIENQGGY